MGTGRSGPESLDDDDEEEEPDFSEEKIHSKTAIIHLASLFRITSS
jgi:hypothetical protein